MSVEFTRNPPILGSFIRSDLFDLNLIPLIAKHVDARSGAAFSNVLTFHPDFIEETKLRNAHVTVLKLVVEEEIAAINQQMVHRDTLLVQNRLIAAQRVVRNMTEIAQSTSQINEADAAVHNAVKETFGWAIKSRNPFLLDKLISESSWLCDCSSAAVQAACKGDLVLLQRLMGHVLPHHKDIARIALRNRHFHVVDWLIATSFTPSQLLVMAFGLQTLYWQQMVIYILGKITPDDMPVALFTCAQHVIQLEPDKMEFLLQETQARTLINAAQWGQILAKPCKNIDTFAFILDPQTQISFSFEDRDDRQMAQILYYSIAMSSAPAERVPPVLAQILPDKMERVLLLCAKKLFMDLSHEQMADFLQLTDAKTVLGKEHWREILGQYHKYSEKMLRILQILAIHQIPTPLDDVHVSHLGFFLAMAISSSNWKKEMPQMLNKIPSAKMRESLAVCGKWLIKAERPIMERFLRDTQAKELLYKDDWDPIVMHRLESDVLFFILDPNQQISLSSRILGKVIFHYIEQECWDCVEAILSSNSAQKDSDFLKKIVLSWNEFFYKNYLDKYIHLFHSQNRPLDVSLKTVVNHALQWKCDNVLAACIDSPQALQAIWYNFASRQQMYVISNEQLAQIAALCSKTENSSLKEKERAVEEEIAWRRIWPVKY